MVSNGTTVGGVDQRNYSYDGASHLNLVTADARPLGAADPGVTTLFMSPTYNAAGKLTAASLAVSPTTQQSMIGLTRTYDLSLRPLTETDTGQLVDTPGTPSMATVNVTGTEQSIGGSGTPAQATGTISLSYSGGAMVRESEGALRVQPLLVGSSITLPSGYKASFVASTNSALAVANSIAAVLNAATSPVTAVVSSGGTASAASVVVTTKATGASQNGAITLKLVTQVTAAPASLSGGSGTTYDTGTVMVTVNNTSVNTSYGQLSTPQTIAQSLASAISAAGAGVTATAGSGGALTLTASLPGTADNGMAVTLASSSSEPGLFTSPSFSGSSGTMSGGVNETFSSGTIYSYSIPSPGTAITGYAGNGNLLSFTDVINGQWSSIGYDTLNRLKTATVAGTPSNTTLGWSYDAFGNRQSQTPGAVQLSYPAPNNRISGSPYNYDYSGNVIEDASNQYGYDGEGRLCTVYNKTLASYTGYAYDGMGNRAAKGTGMTSLACDNSFATTTSSFVVGQNGEQLDEFNATGSYSNVYANGQLLATYQFATPAWSFALNDWLGTKRVVANASGEQGETCLGLPFGDGVNCADTHMLTGDPSPQHFTGKERDAESGLDYFGARYYASNMGRWMSPDWAKTPEGVPYADLSNPQSLNLYGYVLNNPLSHTDSDGHQCDWCNSVMSWLGVSHSASASGSASAGQGSASNGGLSASAQALTASGSASASYGMNTSVGAKASASVAAATVNEGANSTTQMNGLTANAGANAGVGLGGKAGVGVSAGASANADVLTASQTEKVTMGPVTITGTATGAVGIGANASASLGTNGVSASAGVTPGVGGGLSLSITWNGVSATGGASSKSTMNGTTNTINKPEIKPQQ